jgi:hypothetical protein
MLAGHVFSAALYPWDSWHANGTVNFAVPAIGSIPVIVKGASFSIAGPLKTKTVPSVPALTDRTLYKFGTYAGYA